MRPQALALGLVLIAFPLLAAAADVPDLFLSHAETAALEPVSVFVVPNGSGTPLTEAFSFGGNQVDATITVTLLDVMGDPVVGYPREEIWLETSLDGLVTCADGAIADADTDIYGETTFTLSIRGSGQTDSGAGELTQVVVGGAPLASPGMDIQFNSADLNGDLRVDLCDIVRFGGDFLGGYAYAADYRWDGVVNLSDVVHLTHSFAAHCPGAPGPEATPETLHSRLGIYFDAEGESNCTTAAPGFHGPGFAYIVATDISEAGGLAGWECGIDLDGPVYVLDWGIIGSQFFFTDPDFVVVLDTPQPWQSEIVLADMLMYLENDTEPVTFSLGAANVYTAGPYPAYARPGDTCNTVPIWPSCFHDTAVINGPCPQPGLVLSAETLDFTLHADESAGATVTLTDQGTVADPVESLQFEIADPGLSWLTVTPLAGSIDTPAGTAEITLDLDSTGLEPGLYEFELVIVSNACHLPFARVAIELVVRTDWTAIDGPWAEAGVRGVAWADFDGDRDCDLYLTRGDDGVVANRLYRNDGADTFADAGITLLEDMAGGYGATWGDLDEDGLPDLMVANSQGANRLFRNEGGGVFAEADDGPWNNADDTRGATWIDYDNDGYLDLFLAQVLDANLLLQNQGDGTFTDVSASPLGDPVSCRNAAWADFDDDGDVDVYLVNRDQANRLCRNDGGGVFTDVTASPLDDATNGSAAAWGDYDNDGDLDLYLVRRDGPNRLFRNLAGGNFADVTTGPLGDPGPGRGAAWGDHDNDGDLDLCVTNDGTDILLRNDGGSTFVDVTPEELAAPDASRGVAWCDHDGDGDLDLFVGRDGDGGLLLRNNLDNDNHWLQIDLVGTLSNHLGIGARVDAYTGGRVQAREVMSSTGYFSQGSLTVEFGLASLTVVDSVTVRWPSGIVNTWRRIAADQRLSLTEMVPGPVIQFEAAELAQDAFPEFGSIDIGDLGANDVRFDMGRSIAPPTHFVNDPGDSIVATFLPGMPQAVVETPRLRYIRHANPLFDPYRNSWPDVGMVEGLALGDSRWSFDLPDSNFLYPGDILHYHLEATNTVEGWEGTSTAPADLAGYGQFIEPSALVGPWHPRIFAVHALPTVFNPAEGDQPPILWWNDGGVAGESHWLYSFFNLGLFPGRDFDIFTTNQPEVGGGNGLGGRATSLQIAGYETVVYRCDDLATYTLSNGDFYSDPGPDLSVLDQWLHQGDHNLLLSGNHLLADLVTSGPEGAYFAYDWLASEFAADDIAPLIDEQPAPLVQSVPGNPIFFDDRTWRLDGGGVVGTTFDAVEYLPWAESFGEYLDPSGAGGQYSYTAGLLHPNTEHTADIVYLPYDLRYLRRPAPDDGGWLVDGTAVRTQMLGHILMYFGHAVPLDPLADAPAVSSLAVRARPNPFNPRTTIEYYLPRADRLTVAVYGMRGERLRTLVDGAAPAGPGHVIWDGTDQGGRRVASGSYFCRVLACGQEVITRVTLVK